MQELERETEGEKKVRNREAPSQSHQHRHRGRTERQKQRETGDREMKRASHTCRNTVQTATPSHAILNLQYTSLEYGKKQKHQTEMDLTESYLYLGHDAIAKQILPQ